MTGPFVSEERLERSLARLAFKTPRQLASLRSWRVGPADERAVQVFFHTHAQAKAESLAAVLNTRGFQVQARANQPGLAWEPTFLERASWLVTGLAPPLAMNEGVLLPWSEAMCRLALVHDCEFNGWYCPTPDFLERNDDFHLCGSEDGRMELLLYRWTAASEAALAENDISRVSPHARVGSLKVLAPYADKIRALKSPAEELPFDDIELLHHLEDIYLWRSRPTHGDYRKLPRLRSFRCLDADTLNPQFLNNPSLRSVELKRPRKLKTLKAMDAWGALESLVIDGGPMASLEGLQHCKSLRELRLANCKSLADIEGLALAPGIQILEIFRTPKLQGVEPIAALGELRWIAIVEKTVSLSSHDVIKHWPQVQSVTLLVRVGDVDFAALAQGPSVAELLLYTHEGFQLPGDDEFRRLLQAQGKTVRSHLLWPKDEYPSFHATFESPYWRLPARPEGHARRFVV